MRLVDDWEFFIFQVVVEVSFDLLFKIISPTPRAPAQITSANSNGIQPMKIRYVEIWPNEIPFIEIRTDKLLAIEVRHNNGIPRNEISSIGIRQIEISPNEIPSIEIRHHGIRSLEILPDADEIKPKYIVPDSNLWAINYIWLAYSLHWGFKILLGLRIL